MDHEQLVRRAGGGDVEAFVELTSRFQQFAFGSALALVRDFQQAEDVVQEAFVAAWSALPTLAEPAAFPGWLRGIVRHHAFRLRRRKQLRLGSARRGGKPAGRKTLAGLHPGAAPPGRRRARRDCGTAGQAARTGDARLRPRLLAPGRRDLPRAVADDRQQPPACRPFPSETEARHGHRHAARPRTARRVRPPHRPPDRDAAAMSWKRCSIRPHCPTS